MSLIGGRSVQFSGWENNFEGIILLVLHTECHCGKESISLWMCRVQLLDKSKHTQLLNQALPVQWCYVGKLIWCVTIEVDF